jgi:kinesin family protein 18/19
MPKRSTSPGRRPPADGGGSADTERRARGENITVAVRVRPLTSLEKSHNAFVTVEAIDEAHVLVNDPDDKMGGIDYLRLDKTKTKHYRLDSVFGPESTQAAVYAATARPLARKVVEGYNACCFAYGATGAGKTFTMTGTLDDPGVIPLTLDDLVLVAAEQKEEYDVKISMQYVEIYNEKLKDLLNPSDAVLDVREVPSKGTYVAGATDKEVATCAEMMELIHGPRAIRRNSPRNFFDVPLTPSLTHQAAISSAPPRRPTATRPRRARTPSSSSPCTRSRGSRRRRPSWGSSR